MEALLFGDKIEVGNRISHKLWLINLNPQMMTPILGTQTYKKHTKHQGEQK